MKFTDTIEITVRTIVKGKSLAAKETVPAKHYGPLAIHADLIVGKRQQYKISHRATGLGIAGELTLIAAQRMAKELATLPQWNEDLSMGWTPATAATFDTLRSAVQESRNFYVYGGTRTAA